MRAVLLITVLLGGLILAGCAGSVGVMHGDYWATESYTYATPYPYAYVYPYPRSYYRPFPRPWGGYRGGYWGGGGYRSLSPSFRSHEPRYTPAPRTD